MVEELAWEDYTTIAVYFLVVIAVGILSTCRPNRGNSKGYFLAGKNMHWIPIGASIYASNVGAPMFLGMAGSAAASGWAITIYEWHAVFLLIALGWVFCPVYIASGSFTTPQYLRKRFGGRRIRICSAIFALVGYILFNISIEMFSGALFLQRVLGWNIYLTVTLILIVTAVYTIVGGLASVIYTDTLQTIILITGATILFVISIKNVGGWEAMETKYMLAATNYTLQNATFYKCGLPREDSLHIGRSALTGDITWPGALIGLQTIGFYVWCQDQLIVQRCLSAKNMSHAKAGTLLGGLLKLTSFLLFVIPGMVSRILYTVAMTLRTIVTGAECRAGDANLFGAPDFTSGFYGDEIACADPVKCQEICGNPAGCSNLAYPLLILRLLPAGIKGLMLAALLAALMSSLTSILNSASAVITLDIWRMIRKNAKNTELMIVGRVTVLLLVATSILWLPVMERVQGGQFWNYMQSIRSYLIPPWSMVYILGIFWKRSTEQGVFWGLVFSLVVGLIRMVLDFIYIVPPCGSGEVDDRPSVVARVNFLHFAIILAVVSTIVMVTISLCTQPRPERKLMRVTWWTRHSEKEPELESEDEKEDEEESATMKEEFEEEIQEIEVEEVKHKLKLLKSYCLDWLFGTVEKHPKLSKIQVESLRKKLTSLHENPKTKRTLNVLAIASSLLTVFLIGVFL